MTNFEIEKKLREVYQQLKVDFGIRYNNRLEIVISNRLRCSNGRCSTSGSKSTGEVIRAKIIMSKALLDEFGWESFETTFRHEVAHLANRIIGGKNHDNSFKRLCKKFGGSMAPEMATAQFADCAQNNFVEVIIKWIYTCPCGFEKKMAKRMNGKKRGNPNYRCGKCRIYTLDTWTEKQVA